MTVPAQSPNPRVESDQGAGVIAPETASEVAGPGASVLGSHDGVEQDEAALNGVDDVTSFTEDDDFVVSQRGATANSYSGSDTGSDTGLEARTHGGIAGVARAGTLVLVATPIGNLGDLSDRARTALREASAIAAEDTRHTRKLLSSQGISGVRLLAVHEHNEQAATNGIVGLLARGETIALVTDAGTPGISDPGMRVVAGVIEAGHEVVCVPGPAAFVAALVVSGLPTERFVFESFLPRTGAQRQAILAEIAVSQKTTVFYEAPSRVVRTLGELAAACGELRAVSVSRELTKRFEQTWRGSLAAAAAYFTEHEPKGEFVVTVGPATKPEAVAFDDETVRQLLRAHITAGKRNREAIDAVVEETGLPRKHVYALAVSKSS
jgi:16S rRNA (cytidine1402-2'-O)-methyltransferase